MAVAPCPDCGQKIKLGGQIKVGRVLYCPHCEAELEVISREPLEFDWAYLEPAEDEDWDDWDDDDDDDDDDH